METQVQNQAQAQVQGPVITNPNAKVIKRYQNRKLYDTQQSCYVTLEDIAKMIRNNEEVVVIDNKTKRDITSSTLTQIIFEAEKKNKNFISIETLREIIQTGAGSISSYLEKVLNRPVSGGEADVGQVIDHTARSFDDLSKVVEDRLARAKASGEIGGMKDRLTQLQQKLSTLESKIGKYSLEN